MHEVNKPAPGSTEAIALGCICPVLDNAHGRGYLGDGERFGWVVVESCPIHGKERKNESAPHTYE